MHSNLVLWPPTLKLYPCVQPNICAKFEKVPSYHSWDIRPTTQKNIVLKNKSKWSIIDMSSLIWAFLPRYVCRYVVHNMLDILQIHHEWILKFLEHKHSLSLYVWSHFETVLHQKVQIWNVPIQYLGPVANSARAHLKCKELYSILPSVLFFLLYLKEITFLESINMHISCRNWKCSPGSA